METFNVVSGAIDALIAVALYAVIVFGIRGVVHRVRKTEADPANNRWLWLTVLGLSAAVFVGGGAMADASSGAEAVNPCDAVNADIERIGGQITETTAPYRHAGLEYFDKLAAIRQDNEQAVTLYGEAARLVINNPDCFDAATRMTAETKFRQIMQR